MGLDPNPGEDIEDLTVSMSDEEQNEVLDLLHEESFEDQLPPLPEEMK